MELVLDKESVLYNTEMKIDCLTLQLVHFLKVVSPPCSSSRVWTKKDSLTSLALYRL